MTAHVPATAGAPVRAIRLAILAMGGEGGGVLANWVIDLAESNGYIAQMTSVPGVAQRTGATIYYVEMFPLAALPPGRLPVLAQMPVPGDVDVVIASELMEAGRAVQRGIVTPDRTTLIASTHRVHAIAEKVALGDGRSDEAALLDACRGAARRLVATDMALIAEKTGSVISAVMFGALAAASVLPFQRRDFEDTITRGGVGVAASKRAFAAGFDAALGKAPALDPVPVEAPLPPTGDVAALQAEAERLFPSGALATIREGIARAADFQDLAYARLYVERLKPVAEAERKHGDGSGRVLLETARFLALGMAYEDPIRVADLKTRKARFARVADEVRVKEGQVLQIREYMHPRLQEIAETVPAPLGRAILGTRWLRAAIEQVTASGRVVETSSIRGFLLLKAVAGLRRWRRSSLRYAAEQASLEAWLAMIAATLPRDPALAAEVAELRDLVKGYSDTHARGSANYAAILALLPRIQGPSAAGTLATLRKAALADDTGEKLAGAIRGLGLA
jgi:indolepyruvate ferredoxin oxidoreductase beta subunit